MKKSSKKKPRYWFVKIDTKKCSICEACINRCPTGAISLKKGRFYEVILFDYKHCDACQGKFICKKICPEKAIKVIRRISKPPSPCQLIRGKISRCIECGAPFVPLKKIEAVFAKEGVAGKDLQKSCPDCRRKNLIKYSANFAIR